MISEKENPGNPLICLIPVQTKHSSDKIQQKINVLATYPQTTI
jgi:hypothetical protein